MIEKGELTVDGFLDTLETFIKEQVNTVDLASIPQGETKTRSQQNARLDTPCPQCGREIVISTKVCACTGCSLKIWRTLCGKTLTDNQIATLVKAGKTPVITGFTSKAGKKFDAVLRLEQDGKIAFEFEGKR